MREDKERGKRRRTVEEWWKRWELSEGRQGDREEEKERAGMVEEVGIERGKTRREGRREGEGKMRRRRVEGVRKRKRGKGGRRGKEGKRRRGNGE